MKDEVTTLIISYNNDKYIAQAIESALQQKCSFKHKILISDDGSDDSSRKIITDYCKKYPYIIQDISYEQNRGISYNYMNSLKKIKSEFVAILEGDDFWVNENKLERQYRCICKSNTLSMVYTINKKIHEMYRDKEINLIDYHYKKYKPSEIKIFDTIVFFKMNASKQINNFSGCMFRTNLIHLLPYYLYHYRISEKTIAFFMINFGNIAIINNEDVVYRIHSKGAWSGLSKKNKTISAFLIRILCFLACGKNNRDLFLRYTSKDILLILKKMKAYNIEYCMLLNKFLIKYNKDNNKYIYSSIKDIARFIGMNFSLSNV